MQRAQTSISLTCTGATATCVGFLRTCKHASAMALSNVAFLLSLVRHLSRSLNTEVSRRSLCTVMLGVRAVVQQFVKFRLNQGELREMQAPLV